MCITVVTQKKIRKTSMKIVIGSDPVLQNWISLGVRARIRPGCLINLSDKFNPFGLDQPQDSRVLFATCEQLRQTLNSGDPALLLLSKDDFGKYFSIYADTSLAAWDCSEGLIGAVAVSLISRKQHANSLATPRAAIEAWLGKQRMDATLD